MLVAVTLSGLVRVLLLERSVEQEWWQQVLGAGGDRIAVESTLHGLPLEVGNLPQEALWTTIDTLAASHDQPPEQGRDEILHALAEIDQLGRPVFALMAADALAAGNDLREWDKHNVLRYVLERNDRLFWTSESEAGAPGGVETQHYGCARLLLVRERALVSGAPRRSDPREAERAMRVPVMAWAGRPLVRDEIA